MTDRLQLLIAKAQAQTNIFQITTSKQWREESTKDAAAIAVGAWRQVLGHCETELRKS